MPTKRSRKPSPNVPSWLKAALRAASPKPNDKLTMRDIDGIVLEVRAGGSSGNFKPPVKLTVTLLPTDAEWLNQLAAEQHCSIEEILTKAVWFYRYGGHNQLLEEDREYFTKAIAQSTERS
jgi:hypothetical protein